MLRWSHIKTQSVFELEMNRGTIGAIVARFVKNEKAIVAAVALGLKLSVMKISWLEAFANEPQLFSPYCEYDRLHRMAGSGREH